MYIQSNLLAPIENYELIEQPLIMKTWPMRGREHKQIEDLDQWEDEDNKKNRGPWPIRGQEQ